MGGELPAKGELAELPLPRLLVSLNQSGFAGELRLSRDRVEKRFLFHAGVPVTGESNLSSEGLAAQLSEAGQITRADVARVAEFAKERGCHEGQALRALELVDARGLFEALRQQLRRRLLECFAWSQGRFALDASVAAPEAALPFRLDVLALVQEGIESHWGTERVLMDLQDRMALYPQDSPLLKRAASKLADDDAVRGVIEGLDGERTLWQVLQAASSPRVMAAVWVLDAAGAFRFSEQPQSAAEPEATPEIEIVIGGGEPKRPAARRARKESSEERKPRAEAEGLRTEIDEKWEKLGDLDHYTLLGVAEDAAAGAIKSAYLKAARRYHPDVISRAGLDEDTLARANKVFAAIGKAYTVLSDAEQRAQYDARDSAEVDFDAERLASAETLFLKGEVLLRSGNFKGALEFLLPAVELWPDECAYQSAVGWALYKKLPSEPERALEHLQRAAELDPTDDVASFRLDVVQRTVSGEPGAAGASPEA